MIVSFFACLGEVGAWRVHSRRQVTTDASVDLFVVRASLSLGCHTLAHASAVSGVAETAIVLKSASCFQCLGQPLPFLLCYTGYVDYLQSRGITVNEMDESRMLGTLFETHMPEYLRRIDNPSAFLVKQFSQFVSARHSLLQTARKAFLGTLR